MSAAQEAKCLTATEHSTNQRRPYLLFPSFIQQTLMQPEWDCRDPSGRINVILSEQTVCRTGSLSEADLGVSNEIVCFSFQHAPKGESSIAEN